MGSPTDLEGQWFVLLLYNIPQRRRKITEFVRTDQGHLEQYLGDQLYAKIYIANDRRKHSEYLFITRIDVDNRMDRFERFSIGDDLLILGCPDDQLVTVLSKRAMIEITVIAEIGRLLSTRNYDSRLYGFDSSVIR